MSADPRKASSKHDEPVSDTSSTLRVKKIFVIDNTAFIDIQFPSSESIGDVQEEKDLVYPEGVIDRRPYQTTARYRKMVGDPTDFIRQPLQVGSEQTKTVVLRLEKFAEDHGCLLIFDNEDRGFDQSLFRAVGGEVDLGSVHLLANASLLTAQFDLKVNLDFHKDLSRSEEDLRKFVQDFCPAMKTVLPCHINDFRVFSIHGIFFVMSFLTIISVSGHQH